MEETYVVNSAPEIVSEEINGEVVIINLKSGRYYQVEGAGVDLWALLAAEHSFSDITSYVEQRYQGYQRTEEQRIRQFVDDLVQHDLAHKTVREDYRSQQYPPPDRATKTFTGIGLNTFSDLDELLRLDPIHEVDQASGGWPNV